MIGAGGLASTRLSRSRRVSSREQSRARPCHCNAPAHDEGLFATRADRGIKALKTVTLEEKAPIGTLLKLIIASNYIRTRDVTTCCNLIGPPKSRKVRTKKSPDHLST